MQFALPPRTWSLLVLLAVICLTARGETNLESHPHVSPRGVDGSSLGNAIDLTSAWLFKQGDDPSYASPLLDDRQWTVVNIHRSLGSYGFRDIVFCWYRLHVRISPISRNPVIGVSGVGGFYELFVNGMKIGGSGRMVAHVVSNQGVLKTFLVPGSLITDSHGDLVIALRFVADRVGAEGRGTVSPLSASSTVVLESAASAGYHAGYVIAHRNFGYVLSGVLGLLVGLVSLALFLALRSHFEYLAIAMCTFGHAATNILTLLATSYGTYTFAVNLVVYGFNAIATVALIEFVRLVLGLTYSRLFLILEVACFVGEFGNATAQAAIGPLFLSFVAYFIPVLAIYFLLPILLLRGFRRGNLDARVLLPALLLFSFSVFWNFANQAAFYLRLTPRLHSLPSPTFGTYSISLFRLCSISFYLAILLFLVLRTIRITRDRARIAGEIESAQTVQRLLLARSSEPTPGFTVESVYHPAGEVGGDFFLVSPGPHGSLTAIVGDVSGKGLIAAMRVAMILGVLRREESREPATILGHLNEALLNQGEMGFTTACCVQLAPDGAYTIANAGHIPPYLDGREIETPPALPLGLADDSTFDVVHGTLLSGQKLVLMSDGVVEARSPKGELYGFERLAELTRLPAQAIADLAQKFGQEDDITVLTIACAC